MRRDRMLLGLLGLVLLVVGSPAIGAELYSWQDAHGQWHYADEPPPAGGEALSRDDLPTLNSMRPPGASPYRSVTPRAPRSTTAGRGEARQARACAGLERRLDEVQRQLRAGYREPTGNCLRARRRTLQERLRREC